MSILVLRDLFLAYPGLDRPALDIPALEIAPGGTVAVTGPSGCGKTSLIHVLSGLERASRGHVEWQGRDIEALGEGERDRWRADHVGLVMQEFHLFPGLTAFQNVVLPRRLARLRLEPAIAEEAKRLLARVGIDNIRQPIETMSRGQMQRVAVARALVARPGIIVADEPTASLDPEAGAAVGDLLIELARDAGATLLVASHDTRLITRMDRVLRLEFGRLVEA